MERHNRDRYARCYKNWYWGRISGALTLPGWDVQVRVQRQGVWTASGRPFHRSPPFDDWKDTSGEWFQLQDYLCQAWLYRIEYTTEQLCHEGATVTFQQSDRSSHAWTADRLQAWFRHLGATHQGHRASFLPRNAYQCHADCHPRFLRFPRTFLWRERHLHAECIYHEPLPDYARSGWIPWTSGSDLLRRPPVRHF